MHLQRPVIARRHSILPCWDPFFGPLDSVPRLCVRGGARVNHPGGVENEARPVSPFFSYSIAPVTTPTQVVLFDLDDTLTDRRVSLHRYVARLVTDYAAKLGPTELAAALAVVDKVDENGYAPRARVFEALQRGLQWRATPELGELAEHWERWFPFSTVLRPGALEMLQVLRDAGYPLGLVTNGPIKLQQAKIDCVGIAPLLSAIVISEEVGCHKPDARVFLRALEKLSRRAEGAWFVGDHPRNDILGAAAVGLKPIWLAGIHEWPAGTAMCGIRVDTLEEALREIITSGGQ